MLLRAIACLLPNKKPGRVAMGRSKSRRPSGHHWLHYADPALAPMCRSATGFIVPITAWPQCADHKVAPLCRSSNGSYVPVGDTRVGRFMPRWSGARPRARLSPCPPTPSAFAARCACLLGSASPTPPRFALHPQRQAGSSATGRPPPRHQCGWTL